MGGVENQILVSVAAIHLALFFTGFFNALTRDIVLPLLSVSSVEDGVAKLVVQVGTVKINIGDFMVQTINLSIAIAVVYFTLPHFKEYVAIAGRR